MAIAAQNMTIRYVITKQTTAGSIGFIVQTTLMAIVGKQTLALHSTTIRQSAQIILQVYRNSTTDLTSKNIIVEDITDILMYNIKYPFSAQPYFLTAVGDTVCRIGYLIYDYTHCYTACDYLEAPPQDAKIKDDTTKACYRGGNGKCRKDGKNQGLAVLICENLGLSSTFEWQLPAED